MIDREDAEAISFIERFNDARTASNSTKISYLNSRISVIEKTRALIEAHFELALAERDHHQSFIQQTALRQIDLSQAIKPPNPSLVVKDLPDKISVLYDKAHEQGIIIKINPVTLPDGTEHCCIEFVIY